MWHAMPPNKTSKRATAAAILKARRLALGLSAQGVADTVGTSLRTIWRCEKRGTLPQTKAVRSAYLALLGLDHTLTIIPKKDPA